MGLAPTYYRHRESLRKGPGRGAFQGVESKAGFDSLTRDQKDTMNTNQEKPKRRVPVTLHFHWCRGDGFKAKWGNRNGDVYTSKKCDTQEEAETLARRWLASPHNETYFEKDTSS